MQSPALRILKEVDEFLFCHLGKLERLAAAYKSFKLLKFSMIAVLFSKCPLISIVLLKCD